MIAEKLNSLIGIKAELKSAIEDLTGETLTDRFSTYPEVIKNYKPETGGGSGDSGDNEADNYALVIKNSEDEIRYKICDTWSLQTDMTNMNAADVNYTTGNEIKQFDYTELYNSAVCPVSDTATAIEIYNYSRATNNSTKLLSFEFMPNLQKIDKFKFYYTRTLSCAFAQFQGEDLSNLTIDLKDVDDISGIFAGCLNLSKYPKFINCERVNNLSYFSTVSLNIKDFNFDLSIFAGNKISNVDNMFNGNRLNENMDYSYLQNATTFGNLFNSVYGVIDLQKFAEQVNPEVGNFEGMFQNTWAELRNIEALSKFKITKADYMFASNWLGNIDVSWMNTDDLESVNGMFNYLFSDDLNLGDFNISKIGTRYNNFLFSSQLKNITGRFIGGEFNGVDFWTGSDLTTESMQIIIDALGTDEPRGLFVTHNCYFNLSEEQIALAGSKGWTIYAQ